MSEIFEIIKRINSEEKVSILLVEQNALMALAVSEYGYIMENGRIVLDGPSKKLMENEDVKEFYLGIKEGEERKKFCRSETLQAQETLAFLNYAPGPNEIW